MSLSSSGLIREHRKGTLVLMKWVKVCAFGFNPLSANPIKWSNTLKQFVDKLPTNCLSVFDHYVGLKG